MKYDLAYPILIFVVSGILTFGAYAQALNVTLSHNVTNVTNYSDGTSTVTLALTIHNQSGENLSNFRLLPMADFGLLTSPQEQVLEVETLADGATLGQNWSLDNVGEFSSDSPLFDQLMFAAEATDANQTLNTFPVNSLRGTEQ